MNIENGKNVALNYVLRVDGPDGEIVEETSQEGPMEFTFGVDPLLPKFEEAIVGLKAGDAFQVAIACDDAYGEDDESLVVEYPKETFIVDGELDEDLFEEGEVIPMLTPDGEEVTGIVIEVKLNSVVVDFNHPLAGEDLYFEGEIVSVS